MNHRNTEQIAWEKSPAHQLFLATFLEPCVPDNYFRGINWKNLLSNEPEKVIERFLQDGVVVRSRLYHLLAFHFELEELKEMAEQRQLSPSNPNETVRLLIQHDAVEMWRAVASRRKQKVVDVAKLLQCSVRGQEIATQFLTNYRRHKKEIKQSTIDLIEKVFDPLFQARIIHEPYQDDIKDFKVVVNTPYWVEQSPSYQSSPVHNPILGENCNKLDMLPRQFNWEKSQPHVEFLITFYKARHPDEHPLDDKQHGIDWERELGESPTTALERFMYDGVVIRCSRTQLFTDLLDVNDLETMSRERDLPVLECQDYEHKDALIRELLTKDELSLWREAAKEPKRIYDIAQFVQCSNLGQQIADCVAYHLENEDFIRWLLSVSGIALAEKLRRQLKGLLSDVSEPELPPGPEEFINPLEPSLGPSVKSSVSSGGPDLKREPALESVKRLEPDVLEQELPPELKEPLIDVPDRPYKSPGKPIKSSKSGSVQKLESQTGSQGLLNAIALSPLFNPLKTVKSLRSGKYTVKDFLMGSMVSSDPISLGFLDASYLKIFAPIGALVGVILVIGMIIGLFNLLVIIIVTPIGIFRAIANDTFTFELILQILPSFVAIMLSIVAGIIGVIVLSSTRARIIVGLLAVPLILIAMIFYTTQILWGILFIAQCLFGLIVFGFLAKVMIGPRDPVLADFLKSMTTDAVINMFKIIYQLMTGTIKSDFAEEESIDSGN